MHVAETIINNIRVLATDQRYEAEDEEGKTPVRTFGSVTLEATPEIAQRIAVAQVMGKLSLSLRPLAESGGDLDVAIATGAINVPAKGGVQAERSMLAAASQRPSSGKASAVSGGDVSRYWIPVGNRPRSAPNRDRLQQQYGGNNYGAMPRTPTAPAAVGPSVRVTRGDQVTVVPVGGK